MNYIKKQE